MQLYQVDELQESKENLLRNNYGKEAINNELSNALHSTGAQYQMQSQVQEYSSDEARGLVNGQQPQPVQTTLLTFPGGRRGLHRLWLLTVYGASRLVT